MTPGLFAEVILMVAGAFVGWILAKTLDWLYTEYTKKGSLLPYFQSIGLFLERWQAGGF